MLYVVYCIQSVRGVLNLFHRAELAVFLCRLKQPLVLCPDKLCSVKISD